MTTDHNTSAVLSAVSSPIVIAPMAGGPTTPQLVIAAARAGSFSALAAGTLSVADTRAAIAELSRAGLPWGLNLFVPQPEDEQLRAQATEYAAEPIPDVDLRFGFEAKVQAALAADHPPAVIWTMFGLPPRKDFASDLRARGIELWVTVTCEQEAQDAIAADAAVLVIQGPEAGGHRGTWDLRAEPDNRPLAQLVDDIAALVATTSFSGALLAAGGVRTADDAAAALATLPIAKVVCGSAFLLATEAGTSTENRELLSAGTRASVSTRAFSGRVARGLETPFSQAHHDMPPIYPYLNTIVAPQRAQARAAGRYGDIAYCLVGERPAELGAGSVAEILRRLEGRG